jgi:hypothetical protein
MTRQLFLAAAVLVVAAGCASSNTPPSPADTTRSTVVVRPTTPAVPSPATPTGITSQDAARVAPLAPARLTAVADTGSVRLAWPDTGEDVAAYQCLRRTAATSQWQPIGRTAPGETIYLDRVPGDGTYTYGVQAVSAYGTVSAITESPLVTVG